MRVTSLLYISIAFNAILLIALLVSVLNGAFPVLTTVMCPADVHQYVHAEESFSVERTDGCTIIVTNDSQNPITVKGKLLTVGNEPPQKPDSLTINSGVTTVFTSSGTLTIGP